MIAAALALGATVERTVPWLPTPDDSVRFFQAMERYARGDLQERLAASDDMSRAITRFGLRVFEDAKR